MRTIQVTEDVLDLRVRGQAHLVMFEEEIMGATMPLLKSGRRDSFALDHLGMGMRTGEDDTVPSNAQAFGDKGAPLVGRQVFDDFEGDDGVIRLAFDRPGRLRRNDKEVRVGHKGLNVAAPHLDQTRIQQARKHVMDMAADFEDAYRRWGLFEQAVEEARDECIAEQEVPFQGERVIIP